MDLNDQPVRFFMPDGFTEEDLHAPEYSGPLLAAAAPMAEHARKLAADMDEADFDPSTRFDTTLNGAFTMIDDFFETLVGYAQGRVPAFAADALVSATNALVEKQQRRFGDVCAAEINAVGQAFRKSHLLWSRRTPTPRKPRGVYVRLLFKSKEEIVDAIGDLACAFAKHQAQKPPPGKDGETPAAVCADKPSRARRGISQAAIAKAFCVSRKEVSRWESGAAPAPAGYSRELRLAGDLAALRKIQLQYEKARRDVYAAKCVIHNVPI